MIAGWSIFGGAYLLSTLVGTATIDDAKCRSGVLDDESDPSECEEDTELLHYGRRMLIPVVGPFFAMATQHADVGAMLVGLHQVGGLAAGITGTVLYCRTGRREIATVRIGRGGSLAFDVRPRGPGVEARLSLAF
jgi:hypothetical protein